MKTRFLLALTALFMTANSAISRADIAWESDYNSALSKSRMTSKPLFVDFYTDWCGVCKSVDREVFPDPSVQLLARNFVMLKLDAEGAGAPQARAFGVRAYPTLLFLSPQGQIIERLDGGPSARGFVQIMQSVLSRSAASQARPAAAPMQKMRSATPNGATRPKTGTSTLNRMGYAPSAPDWRSQPELRAAVGSDNYSGAFLLDENGVIALDLPAKKAKKTTKIPTKSKKTGAKSKARRVGY
jgi:thiol-disulfide isomerase/thioredoxin